MAYGLKAGLWVRATLRRFNQNGDSALIVKKGDENAGVIFILLTDQQQRSAILQETGHVWRRHNFEADSAHAYAEKIDSFFKKQIRFDPDLWIIEISVKNIDHPVETLLDTRKLAE
ncbi:DUF1491 family protein [Aristophania vespae]|uniref:DUF1491 family protein n=1 Tax=Aristophania vespae TaxID=2697033 RepID=UPI002351B47E|nr:DUF1491 family protein [Aristophania vespae]UMM64367.1 hypothetical protein DM15PD_13810 [Aristophania vespae]